LIDKELVAAVMGILVIIQTHTGLKCVDNS
jgi:hypothetical protein